MYAQFQQEYESLAQAHYQKAGVDRRAVFEDTVRTIVAHNSNPINTWKQGINQFSDMTEEEFADYFHLKAEQNCSATVRPKES